MFFHEIVTLINLALIITIYVMLLAKIGDSK